MLNQESEVLAFIKTYFVDEIPSYKEGPVAGVYLIRHIATGKFYVGSSRDLYRRIRQHKSLLALGKHYSDDLQTAYNSDSNLDIVVKRLKTASFALDEEQHFLNEFQNNESAVNVAGNARNSFQGLRHTDKTKQKISSAKIGSVMPPAAREKIRQKMIGRVISQEARDKLSEIKTGVSRPEHIQKTLREANELKSVPVIIGNTEYPSVSAAARAFNVDPKTVYNRIASQTDRFQDWQFLNKETK